MPLPKPWVNKRGRIQLHAQPKRSLPGPAMYIGITVRTRAAHDGVPHRDNWQLIEMHKVEDTTVPLRIIAQGLMRLYATLFGYKHEGSYEGFDDV